MVATPSPRLRALALIAHGAGKLVMRHYADGTKARTKSDKSPVTDADEEAESFILAELRREFPGIPIVAEEESAAGRRPTVGGHFFLVDPLDGTKEFISRNGEFTINIAEVEAGVAISGVVYAPARNRLFLGETPGGAWEVEAKVGTPPELARAHAIKVRTVPPEGFVAVASRSHRDPQTDAYLAQFPVKAFTSAGSSLKFCLIAAGEADIYPRHGRTMEWDTAAGHAVLLAAGGSVTQLDGSPFVYGKAADEFANPFFVARGKV